MLAKGRSCLSSHLVTLNLGKHMRYLYMVRSTMRRSTSMYDGLDDLRRDAGDPGRGWEEDHCIVPNLHQPS
jgi:hypothetical protein